MKKRDESTFTNTAREFEKEFKKAIVTGLTAAFGFLIALSWRDVVTEYISTLTATSPIKGTLISALITTFLAVLGILIVSKILVSND